MVGTYGFFCSSQVQIVDVFRRFYAKDGVALPPASDRGNRPACPRADETGRITGKVAESLTQQPLAGVTVTIGGGEARATTTTTGEYAIANVAPGSYVVRTARIGYQVAEERVTVVANQPATLNFFSTRAPSRSTRWYRSGTGPCSAAK